MGGGRNCPEKGGNGQVQTLNFRNLIKGRPKEEQKRRWASDNYGHGTKEGNSRQAGRQCSKERGGLGGKGEAWEGSTDLLGIQPHRIQRPKIQRRVRAI